MISKPTLLINSAICKVNTQKMAEKAQKHKLIFRPHFKTHQSIEVASFYRKFGVTKITVSSISMAEHFASNGWTDITVAFPVNILEIETINKLASNVHLNLVFESIETVDYLSNKLDYAVGAFIKIDTGYGRTGILVNDISKIETIIEHINLSNEINLLGFLCHAGHTYQAKGKPEVLSIHDETVKAMNQLKVHFHEEYPNLIYSIGDTPSCSIADNFTGISEIRPGNFVYYDAMQLQIGSCEFNEIAAAMACPVVAKHKERNEVVIYGGAVHLSKESINSKAYGQHFGLIAESKNNNWENLVQGIYVKKLSQEHGIIHCTHEFFEKTHIGDLVYIIPVHSCLTANLLKDDTLII